MERQGPDPIDNQTVVSTETKLHGPRIRSPRPVLATASMVVLVAGIIGASAAWVRSTGPGIHSERVSTIGASRTNADPSAFPGGSPTAALAEITGPRPSPIPKPSPFPSPTTVPVHKSGPEPTGEPAPRPTPKPAPRSTATLTAPGSGASLQPRRWADRDRQPPAHLTWLAHANLRLDPRDYSVDQAGRHPLTSARRCKRC
jgi:hypothetical protein